MVNGQPGPLAGVRVPATLIVIALTAALVSGCRPSSTPEDADARVLFVTTIYPFRAILEPVVGEQGRIHNLLPAGASPHTYDPRPSDARAASRASVLFYGAAELDEWGARLTSGRRAALLDYLPHSQVLHLSRTPGGRGVHRHSEGRDPHFWMDPLAVKAVLPGVVDELCRAAPEDCDGFRLNASAFSARLTALHDSVSVLLMPVRGRSVLLSHPFLQYLLKRHGVDVGGLVEEIPGSEPTIRDMQHIIADARRSTAAVILTLPQLPDRAARAVSEALGIPIVELDPIGGAEGRRTYEELILYNANALRRAVTLADSV